MRSRPLSLLVVDDDEGIRSFIHMAFDLFEQPVVTYTASDGQEALTFLQNIQPDLILLDMRMPIMSGWEFAAEYAKYNGHRAPVVVMTASELAARAKDEVGAVAFLEKPFELEALYAVVDMYAPQI